jgi:hypothetical protein
VVFKIGQGKCQRVVDLLEDHCLNCIDDRRDVSGKRDIRSVDPDLIQNSFQPNHKDDCSKCDTDHEKRESPGDAKTNPGFPTWLSDFHFIVFD